MSMEVQINSSVARRASPYGLAILPEKDNHEYTAPGNEAATEQRWRPTCERHGAAMLGIRDLPTERVRLVLDGMPWILEPLGQGERQVPAEVFHRWRALEAEGVPFQWWLWGEEQPQRPKFRVLPDAGATQSTQWAQRSRLAPTQQRDWATPQRDPLVIGVIPTAPSRGVWVLLGRWFH
jgi:hypothetical protein